ncbi:MAG: hypothetical protein H0Z24_06685 [Thermosipho sp. (in: Bacteria)]|nr:hypothetical protein [Thermosipho sp. (in: thermotogales)]
MELQELIKEAHKTAVDKGFWDMERRIMRRLKNKEVLVEEEIEFIQNAFIAQKIMCAVSELGEAIEALRKGNINGKDGLVEEIADNFIWLMDLAGGHNYNLAEKIKEKMEYNKTRTIRHGKNF